MRGPGAGSSGSLALQPPGAPTAALQRCTTTSGAGHHCSAATPAHHLLQGAGWTVSAPGQSGLWTLETDHRCKPGSPLVCRHDNETALHGEWRMENGHSPNQYDDELCMSSAARSLSREENLIKAQMQ